MNAVVKPKKAVKKAAKRQAVKLRAVAKSPAPDVEPIRILHRGVMVSELMQQLDAQPELWNQNVFRQGGAYVGNPHQRVDDIIVRFRDWKDWQNDRRTFVDAPHESVWWGPYDKLPAIQPLVFDLMRWFYAEQLGMVLITRIPPHTNVGRHVDKGWHADYYLKFAVQLKAAAGQRFCYDTMSVETKTGDLYAFNNSYPHWVENPTDEERITLIMCLRLKQPTCVDYKWKGD